MNSLSCFQLLSTLILFNFIAGPIVAGDSLIRVAVFKGEGAGPSAQQLIESLETKEKQEFQITRVTVEEILQGKLAGVDVLVHPGGSGGKQGRALGKEGRKAIRKFIDEGGGFLGVCAGAYLATNDYDWSLNLIDAKVLDRRHWARGKGSVQLQLSPEGSKLFQSEEKELTVYYAQGPLLSRPEWDDPTVPDYESLAIFTTEIAKNGAPQGVMARTSAAVRCDFGRGRVFCFSPHPELTDGMEHLIPLAVAWTAGSKNQ